MTGLCIQLVERIRKLGNTIITCQERCSDVKNDQKKGDYPRAFFLESKDDPSIDACVVGKNPGLAGPLEKEAYRILAELSNSDFATYEGCVRVWKAISREKYNRYYWNTRDLLNGLGLGENGILWAEVAFCEEKESCGITKTTLEKCSKRFLKDILKLVPDGKHIVCLGNEAYEWVRKTPQSSSHKVIWVYHPSGRNPLFSKYFNKTDIRESKRHVRNELCEEFRANDSKHESYYAFLSAEKPFFRLEPQPSKVEDRKPSAAFKSACMICDRNGIKKEFVIDRRDYRHPLDDPRIRHLREDHDKKNEIRLRKRFRRVRD